MPINPLQFTNPQAYSGGMDFSPLSKLGEVYLTAQALGNLSDDPIANARTLTRSGVPSLAQTGLGMQDKEIVRRRDDIANQQAQANWVEQQKLRQSADVRAGSEEARAQALQAEKLKYATREQRLSAVRNPEAGLDINDPEIRRWVALGGDIPDAAKARLGIGTPLFTQNTETGEVQAHQLRADKPFVTPQGHRLLGPGEIAQTRAAGTQLAKDQRALPAVELNAEFVTKHIDETLGHPGKEQALGWKSYFPTSRGSPAAGFESRQEQLGGEAFSAAYETLRGAAGISVDEGKAATNALNRAKLATSVEEFDAALKDFRQRIVKMTELARKRATGPAPAIPGIGIAPGAAAPAAPAAAKPDPLGLR